MLWTEGRKNAVHTQNTFKRVMKFAILPTYVLNE